MEIQNPQSASKSGERTKSGEDKSCLGDSKDQGNIKLENNEVGLFIGQKIKMQEKDVDYQVCFYCDCIVPIQDIISHQQKCQMQQEQWAETLKQQQKVKCPICAIYLEREDERNHLMTCPMAEEKCIRCNSSFIRCLQGQHELECQANFQKCKQCFSKVLKKQFAKHKYVCSIRKQSHRMRTEVDPDCFQDEELVMEEQKNKCKWCSYGSFQSFQELSEHQSSCQGMKMYQQSLAENRCILSDVQFNALDKIQIQSVNSHQKSMKVVKSHIFQMGYDQNDLFLMTQYIEKEAPIIIHFNMTKLLKQFIKDTRYRSLFETNTSLGTSCKQSRKKWEDYLFNNSYKRAQDEERIKYGVINFVNDHQGVKACSHYGTSYMVLNKDVRKRCTISDKRKYGPGEIVTTLKYCGAVLEKFTKKEWRAIYYASKGFEVESKELEHFKEIHIHGPIVFSRDIECIYGPLSEINSNIQAVHQFNDRFGIEIKAIEQKFNL